MRLAKTCEKSRFTFSQPLLVGTAKAVSEECNNDWWEPFFIDWWEQGDLKRLVGTYQGDLKRLAGTYQSDLKRLVGTYKGDLLVGKVLFKEARQPGGSCKVPGVAEERYLSIW